MDRYFRYLCSTVGEQEVDRYVLVHGKTITQVDNFIFVSGTVCEDWGLQPGGAQEGASSSKGTVDKGWGITLVDRNS